MKKELLEPVETMDKGTWKKVLNFVVEIIKLIIAGFLGGETAGII